MSDPLGSILEIGPPPGGGYATPPYTGPGVPVGGETSHVMRRYSEAYKVGKTVVAIGKTIKIIGAILAAIVGLGLFGMGGMLGSLGAGSAGTAFFLFLVGLVYASAVFLFFFVWGVIVSALGQILKATLDSAVHTSPFVNNEQKATLMSLS